MSVEDSSTIDFVAADPQVGDVILVMVEGRDWNGSNEQLLELQEKINTYWSFIVGGELAGKYPETRGKPVRIELRCVSPPDEKTHAFVEVVRKKLKEEGLHFSVKQIGT